ncbi:hypothetical protein E4T54_01980 [Legionella geestiana]|nr:hypothetical protein E4T54_01980 [Legionella geestiana]
MAKKDPQFISNKPGLRAQRQWLCMVIGHPGMKSAEVGAFVDKARAIKMPPEVIAAAFASLLNEKHFYAFLKYCPGVERRPSVLLALSSLGKVPMITKYLSLLTFEDAIELIVQALKMALIADKDYAVFIKLFKHLPREFHKMALMLSGLHAIAIALRHKLSGETGKVVLHTPKIIIDENLEDAQLLFTETVRLGRVDYAEYLLQEAQETAEALASDAFNSAFHVALRNKDATMIKLLLRFPSIFEYAELNYYAHCHEILEAFALEETHRLAARTPSVETGEIELSNTECRLAATLLEFLTENHPRNHDFERQLLRQLPGVEEIYTLRLENSPLQAPTLGIFNMRQPADTSEASSSTSSHTP